MINLMLMRRAALAAVLAGGALAAGPGTAQAAHEQDNVRHQGQSGLRVDESGYSIARGLFAQLGTAADQSETLAVYPDGPEEDRLETVEVSTVGTATGVGAFASGDAETGLAEADAGVAELTLDFDAITLTSGELRAACAAVPGMSASGSTSLTDAVINVPGMLDIRLDEAPEPGTVIPLPNDLGQVVLNEQHIQPNGSLTVNAMHLMLDDPTGTHTGQMIIGSVNCAPGVEDDQDEADEANEEDEADEADEEGEEESAGNADPTRESVTRRELRNGDGDDAGDDAGDGGEEAADTSESRYRVCVTEPDDREAGDESCW